MKSDQPWVGHVMASSAAACGVDEFSAPDLGIPSAQSAIVIVVDGLGWHNLQEWKGYAPTLRGFLDQSAPLPTCLPSTTAAALTAITTGALPAQSRMVGYSVRQGNTVMNLLQFPGGDPTSWQPVPTYFERLRTTALRPVVVSARKFAASGLTLTSMRGAEFRGADSLEERFTQARQAVRERPSLVYLYWSEIDHAGHGDGVGSPRWLHELEVFDAALSGFLSTVPPDTAVVLVADHGMVNVDQRIDLAGEVRLSDGVELIAGEGRCVHVHVAEGREMEVFGRWGETLGDSVSLVSRESFPDYFGDGPGNDLMGSFVAFAQKRCVIVDSRTQSAQSIAQVGVHGSDSPVETQVPFMILN